MAILPPPNNYVKLNSLQHEHDRARRRLMLLASLARSLYPDVATWAVLHDEWRRLSEISDTSPDLAALYARVDQALGGYVGER
jgi:hypothetical protein